jgi:1-acyl-sn-glycerol-3-phosphate acyltransferase
LNKAKTYPKLVISWKDESVTRDLRRTLRTLGRCLQIAGLFLEASCELLFTNPRTRHDRAAWLHRFCARSLRRMGISVRVHGPFPNEGALITNHLSYLDIVVLASLHPCVFVSKREVANLPIVGWMTTRSGTVYVERGHGGSALKAGAAMHAAASDGLPVVFFPEGTTNPADHLLKFHSGLLSQALVENMPVTAGYLRYSLTEDNGPGITPANNIAWGSQTMLRHVLQFLSLRGVHADVYLADQPIAFSPRAANRKIAATEARDAVAALAPHPSAPLSPIPVQQTVS